jgi:enoyl-CoA hydratase/carnithine racemase
MDLREMEAQRGASDPDVSVVAILQRVEASRYPTIALVHGDAIAGGCELALHCDLRVMADGARIGMPLARIGLVVPFLLGQKLVEIIGAAETRRLLFTGRLIDAARAKAIGMVHEVAPPAEVEKATYELARTIADNAPLTVRAAKLVVGELLKDAQDRDVAATERAVDACFKSNDYREGQAAFAEKRKPRFTGT